jgi:hypothetical protein
LRRLPLSESNPGDSPQFQRMVFLMPVVKRVDRFVVRQLSTGTVRAHRWSPHQGQPSHAQSLWRPSVASQQKMLLLDDVLKCGWSEGHSKWVLCSASDPMQCSLTPFYDKETSDMQSMAIDSRCSDKLTSRS